MTKTLDPNLHDFLESLELGEAQVHENITIFPLMSPKEGSTDYLSLSKAIGEELLQVTEVSDAGSVPDLKVVNRSDRPILLVSGEELIGAKQNRVINLSILFKENSEEEVPVSCSEQGRWSSVSPEFAHSGELVGTALRGKITDSVRVSLRKMGKARSDQGEVWDQVNVMSAKAKVESPTQAMSDIRDHHAESLEKRLPSFPLIPGQRGLLVLVDGKAEGFDFVSRGDAYEELHEKLVKSYILEPTFAEEKKETDPEEARTEAERFLQDANRCDGESHKTIGHGSDHRLTGKRITGSALIHDNEVIHCTLLRLADDDEDDMRPSFLRRRLLREE